MVNVQAGNFAPDVKTKNVTTILIIVVVLIIAVIAAKKVFGLFDNIMEGVGLQDTKEEKENKEYINNEVNRQNALGVNSPWSPKYYTVVGGSPNSFGFTVSQAQKLCAEIWDSVGIFYDSPNKAASAIKQCQNKRNVSFLADGMSDIYGVNLLSWLENKFDTSEQREILAGILRYVNALPAF
jgi:hypothetical protein